jgi:hypothetical protein
MSASQTVNCRPSCQYIKGKLQSKVKLEDELAVMQALIDKPRQVVEIEVQLTRVYAMRAPSAN